MATTKIYAYLGVNQASIDIPVSAKGSVKVDFTGGNIYDRKAYSVATTEAISDPVLQAIIEKSDYFGTRVIIYDIQKQEDSASIEKKEYPDVTSFPEAVNVLKTDYHLKATQLRSPDGVRRVADSLGVVFPNWN